MTAEFWQYDSRIGRRWNGDPKINFPNSPYSCFEGNPIFLSDPIGDTSIYRPDGKLEDLGDLQYETYDGSAQKVGAITIQPMKGSLKSITYTGPRVDNGNVRFVAVYDKKSGKFTGYAWDKDLGYSLEDFYSDARKALEEEFENADNPMWDPDLPGDQAGMRALALGLSVTLPNPILKTATYAANATKATTTVLGKYPDYVTLGTRLKAKIFNVPPQIWNKLSATEQWVANVKFLDQAIARCDKIILSNVVKDISKISGAFRKELEYLVEKGYKLSSDGTQMIKGYYGKGKSGRKYFSDTEGLLWAW